MDDTKIAIKVREWATARVERLKTERAMGSHSCESFEPDEAETGYNGIPKCYLSGNDLADWCKECRRRDEHFKVSLTQRKVERAAFRRLVEAAERLVKESA